MPYPRCASSPLNTKKAGLCLFVVVEVGRGCRIVLALLVSHRAKLWASTITHPCVCGRWGRRVLAPTLCDRHRASLHDPHSASSPPGTKKQGYACLGIALLFGADGGGRTRTVLLPTDFESVTSANSITSAYIVFVKAHYITIITISQFDYYIIAEKYCQ